MKILFLTRYSRIGASSRIRTFQYLPYLKNHNIEYEVVSLFDDLYLAELYSKNKRKIFNVCKSYLKHFFALLKNKSIDLIFIEKELFPWLPFVENTILKVIGVPYVLDYDDAIFHNYDLINNFFAKAVLKNKIPKLIKNSSLVVAGNQYIADYAKKVGARNVTILPSVIDLNHYENTEKTNNKVFNIGWIGTPATQKYLQIITPALTALSKSVPLKLTLVGAKNFNDSNLNIEILPWSEKTEAELIHKFDVGIMPLYDEPWERGKCGYKLIQYMACSKPIIASSVGVNQNIIREGVNGYFANTNEEWINAFFDLYKNPDLRFSMGREGRKIVEKEFCIQVTAPKLFEELLKIVE